MEHWQELENLAQAAADRHDWQEAGRLWASLRAEFPNHPRGYVGGALVARESGDWKEGDRLLAEAMTRFPSIAQIAVGYANFATWREDWEEARRRWTIVRERFPDEQSGYQCGAQISQKLGDCAAYECLLGEMATRFPETVSVAVEHACEAARRADWDEAWRRWLIIPSGAQDPSYFVIARQIWINDIRAGRDDRLERCFAALLNEPLDREHKALPQFIVDIISHDWGSSSYAKRIRDTLEDYLARCSSLTPAGELALLCLDLPHPFANRAALAAKYVLADSIPWLKTIFSVVDNLRLVPGLAEILLQAGAVDKLRPEQRYYLAVLLSCSADFALYERFLAAATGGGANAAPEKEPLGVLSSIYRALQLSKKEPAAPVIASAPRRLKIAVCVSGQLRGYDRALPTWDGFGFDRHDVDYFVHTWKIIGRKFPVGAGLERAFGSNFLQAYRETCEAIGLKEFYGRFPSLFVWFQNANEATEEELQVLYKTRNVVVEDDRVGRYVGITNPEKMYYKVMACFDMALATGKNYDLFVRIRPDTLISAETAIDWGQIYQATRSRMIYTDTESFISNYDWHGMGDQFAVGNLECMSHYSRTHTITREAFAQGLFGCRDHYEGHSNFAYTTFIKGIRIEKLKQIQFKLADPPIPSPDILRGLLLQDMGGRQRDQYDEALLLAA